MYCVAMVGVVSGLIRMKTGFYVSNRSRIFLSYNSISDSFVVVLCNAFCHIKVLFASQ